MSEQPKRLKELIVRAKHPIANNLKKTEEEGLIKSHFDFEISQLIIDHFGTFNGVIDENKSLAELWVFTDAVPISLDECNRLMNESAFEGYWPENLIPIFSNGISEHILIDKLANPDEHSVFYFSHSVFYFSHSDVDFDLVEYFDNYQLMVESVEKCYTEGAYRITDGFFGIENDKELKIMRNLNPKSDYWKIY